MARKPTYRLPILTEETLDESQRALLESMRAGPRGGRVNLRGPFGVYMLAPQYGELTQQLGAFLRFNTSLEPRLSEFAILCIARIWRAQYEWHAHAPIAEQAGVKPQAIRDAEGWAHAENGGCGRARASGISFRNSTRAAESASGTISEFTSFWATAAWSSWSACWDTIPRFPSVLNVFNVPLPEGAEPYFAEPRSSGFGGSIQAAGREDM